MLTDLQKRLARKVLGEGIDPNLALAGGAAMIAQGLVDRGTLDLDFFTTEPRVREVGERVISMLEADAFDVHVERMSPTFARLEVSIGGERCRIDIAQDARITPVEVGSLGPTLSEDELAADKTLTLFARAEPRDFVDVYVLSRHLGPDRLLELAAEKDLGFDRAVFAQMLGTIGRLDRDEFECDDATFADLQRFFEDWRIELAT